MAADYRPARVAPVSDAIRPAARGEAVGSPGQGADWVHLDPYVRPDLDRCALVTIDVQADFLPGGASPLPGTDQVLPAISGLVSAFRSAGRPIAHAVRLYEGTDVDLVRRSAIRSGAPIVRPGSVGSQLAGPLWPSDTVDLDARRLLAGRVQELGTGEVAMWKPRWSAFYRTSLHEHLTSLGVNTVVVVGFNYPNCPRATISDASVRDYRVLVVEDAISGIRDLHLEEASAIGAVSAASSTIVRLLSAVPRPGAVREASGG
ncbi:MAG: cysteine hydrolase [Actinobacteria bacterium]|nr:cysteine hydrolase [Actinomycetota bacterium]